MKKLFLISSLFLVCTLVSAQSNVFHENFEPTSNADSVTSSGGGNPWTINTRLHAGGAQSDSCMVKLKDSTFLITNAFDCSGMSNVTLQFKHVCKIELLDGGEVFVSINNGPWIKLTGAQYINPGNSQFVTMGNKFNANSYPVDWQSTQNAVVPTNAWWKTENFDISTLAGNQSNVRIRFKLSDGNSNGPNLNYGWYLDDIKVVAALSELIPPTITYKPPILQDTVFNTGPFDIYAWLKDVSGIDTAWVVYTVNGGANQYVPMVWVSDSTYKGTIPSYTWNNSIAYRVHAVDNSLSHNSADASIITFYIKQGPNIITIGSGTTTTSYPYNTGWHDSKTQMLYMASDISAAGGVAGQIIAIAFNLASVGSPIMNGFNIQMQNTSLTSLNGFVNTGWTNVYTGSYAPPATGWQTITLGTPFVWDGYSNLLVHICFDNTSFSTTSTVYGVAAANKVWHQYADNAAGCSFTGGSVQTTLPNIKLLFPPDNHQYDAGGKQVTAPTGTVIGGTGVPVAITIKNYALQNLNSVTIMYKVDGVFRDSIHWTGTLNPGIISSSINIDTTNFTVGLHTIKAWTYKPNGQNDQNHYNDTTTGTFYVCTGMLAGTYTIGAGGNFNTFAAAIGTMNNCGISAPVVFNVFSGTYNEQLTIIPITGSSAVNTVTFKPNAGATVTITNSATTTIQFSGADNIIFDGSNNGTTTRDMTIVNSNTGASTAAIWLASSGATAGCSGITIKNCNIAAGSNAAVTYGIGAGGPSIGSTGDDNDNLTVQNNNITKAYYGVWAMASNVGVNNNLIINSNKIGANGSANYVTCRGISIQGATAPTLNKNRIFNIKTTDPLTVTGIDIGQYVTNATVSKNEIYGLHSSNTGGYGSYGINISSGTGTSNLQIFNNFIYDLVASKYGATNTTANPFGIRITGGTNHKIYYNSINMFGAPTTGSSTSMSAALLITTTAATTIDIRNNIFVNSMTGIVGSKSYCIYVPSGYSFAGSTINYNDYYPSGSFGIFGYNGSDVTTLAAWKTYTTQDLNSVNIDPTFISSTELHIVALSVNGLGTTIAAVTDDIDNDLRNATTPDIGADEFTPANFEAADVSIIQPNTGCGLSYTEPITIRIKNNGLLPINGTMTASYRINNGPPVTQAVPGPINSGGTFDFTFTILANLHVTYVDSSFLIKTWITLTGDPFQNNDTLTKTIISKFTPPVPSVVGDTVPYGGIAVLTAASTGIIEWYANPAGGTSLTTGNTYTTPNLYATTVYYTQAVAGTQPSWTFDGDLNGWTVTAPCTTPNNWVWDSDGGAGALFATDPSVSSSQLITSPVVNITGTDTLTLTFNHRFNTESCCDEGYVAYRLDGGPWVQFVPTTGAYNAPAHSISPDPLGSCSAITRDSYSGAQATYMNSSGQIITTGYNTLEIAFAFNSDGSVAGSGWYINNVNLGGITRCTSARIADTAKVMLMPFEASSIELPYPVGDCSGSTAPVTIRVRNNGLNTITSITGNYKILSNPPVTQTFTTNLFPGDTMDYTFTIPITVGLSPANLDTTMNITAWIKVTGDIYALNDTVHKTVTFRYTPPNPIAPNASIPYATSTTLHAITPDSVQWFSGPSGGNPISVYHSYTTPVLYGQTIYYVEAGVTNTKLWTFDSGLDGWIVSAPCTTPNNWAWASDGGAGALFAPDPSVTSSQLVTSPVLTLGGSDSATLTFIHRFITESCCDEGYFAYRFDGGTWNQFVPTTGVYNAPAHYMSPDPLAACGGTTRDGFSGSQTTYMTSSGKIVTTGHSTLELAMVFTSDASVVGTGWYINSVSVSGLSGCHSQRVPDTVFVAGNPACDVGVEAIHRPNTGIELTNAEPVTIRIRNYGTAPASNIPIHFTINGGTPVNEVILGPIAPSDTLYYAFTATADLDSFITYNIAVYATLACDNTHVNDTVHKIVTNNGNPNIDAGVTQFLQPAIFDGVSGSAQTVQVVIRNLGVTTLTTIPVYYTVNGVLQNSQTWTGTLTAGQTANVLFPVTYTIPAGSYELCAYTGVPNEGHHNNDTLCITRYGVFTSSVPYYDNFDGPFVAWAQQDDGLGTFWELGTPAYGVCNSAHSTPNAWDINLTTTYTNNADAYLYTQYFDFDTIVNARMKFWINISVETCCDGLTLEYSIDSSVTWQTLGTVNDLNGTNWYTATTGGYPSWITASGWTYCEYKLTALNNQPKVRFRYHFHSDVSLTYDGASVDDFAITIPSSLDAGVEQIKSPLLQAPAGSLKQVKVKIHNYGTSTLSSIPVAYAVNGGTPVTATWTGTLAPDDTTVYTFATQLAMPAGSFELCSYTQLPVDGDHLNDTICSTLLGIETFVVPWGDNFEGTGHWFGTGTFETWEYGVPTSTTINNAHSPTHCWKTNLDGYYSNNSTEYLYSPYFDFTQVNDATLDFWHWYQTETSMDGGDIQYTLNSGTTWITLGYIGDPNATNWYTYTISGGLYWSGSTAGWIHSTYNLSSIPTIVNATAPVQFRFKFYSNASNNSYDGWAVDDFAITAPAIPKDAGVKAIITPSGSTVTGTSVNVQVTLKNFGTDSLMSIPVAYTINGGAQTQQLWTGTLNPNDTTNFSFTAPFTSPASIYEICAFTKRSGDFYKFNDTTCVSINASAAALDAGVTALLSPGDTTNAFDSIPVQVRIKNFGTSTLTSIPLGYKRNGIQMATATWTGSLAFGDSTTYTFTQKYMSPLSNYSLCAYSMLPNDANPNNDQQCIYPIGVVGMEEYGSEDFYLWQNIPNPANDNTYVDYQIPNAGNVGFNVCDLFGRIVYTEQGQRGQGRHRIELNAKNMAAGIYYYSVEFNGRRLVRKMVITK